MKQAEKKYFGTDGIRNRVGKGMISPDRVLKLGWATGRVMKERGEKTVMIGKDTRISGYMFESALEAGFIAAGIDVFLLGPMPTPAIAYLTQTFNVDAGIVISASHNPHYDNGIKFFSSNGQKVSDEIELAIEAAFDLDLEVVSSDQLGRAERIDGAAERYIEFCKSTYSSEKRLNGYKMVVDCSHGATYHVAPCVFSELGAEVITICAEPDGVNINKDCGATNLVRLKKAVVESTADFGVAFDGDGDRVMLVDQVGEVLDGDIILYILATMQQNLPVAVVGTVMSNLGLEDALKSKGIKLYRTAVGDRHVMQALVDKGLVFGAEPSGHVLCLNKIATGDGIVAALQVLSIMVKLQLSLKEMHADLVMYPHILKNIHIEEASGLDKNKKIKKMVSLCEKKMGYEGRILIRVSGTEPLVRVMVEGKDALLVKKIALELINLVKSEFL